MKQEIRDGYGHLLYAADCLTFKAALAEAVREGVPLPGAYIENQDLSGLSLDWMQIPNAHITNCNLSGTHLRFLQASSAVFTNCRMERTVCEDSMLSQSSFVDCNLDHAAFLRDDLRNSNFLDSLRSTTRFDECAMDWSVGDEPGEIAPRSLSDIQQEHNKRTQYPRNLNVGMGAFSGRDSLSSVW